MRAKGVSIGGSANWLNNFAVGISTSPFVAASSFGTFIFFGVMCILAIIWIWFFLPETKGRTLEEMDELFGEAGFAQADLTLKQRIEREIGLTALLYGDDFAKTRESDEKGFAGEKASVEGQQKEGVREYVERAG